jgi:hypothetical protein
MAHVTLAGNNAWNPQYTVEGWDHERLYAHRTMPAPQETITYLPEVVTYLEPQGKPAAMLCATALGVPVEEVAHTWHCTGNKVIGHCMKWRKKLRAWCTWVDEAAVCGITH